jgi:AraC-like DNA-binding protein
MDTLSPLFARFSLNAQVFYSGSLCGNADFDGRPGFGHLHVLRAGKLLITQRGAKPREIAQPSLIFYPRPCPHRFQVDDPDGAKLVCASIDFGAGMGNPLLRGLPDTVVIPLAMIDGIEQMLSLLFAEAFGDLPGRQAAIDRLAEYFVVLLLRYVIHVDVVNGGVLAALADPRLTKAVTAIHEQPERFWSLEELAGVAGMSRARFAAHFRQTAGITPLDYLTDWRMSVAQTLLKRGKPLKLVAPMVGYSSPVTLSRVFFKRIGMAPAEWLARGVDTEPAK